MINTKKEHWLIATLLIFLIQMCLVYKYLLVPYYLENVSLSWKINGTLYYIISSIIFALILPFAIRATDRITFWFLNSILLLLTANFAISYQDAFIDTYTFSWAEPAWCTTLVGLAWTACFSLTKNELFISKNFILAPFVSIRSLLPLAIFAANVMLLIGILSLKPSLLETAFDVSTLFVLLFIFWTIANEFSIWLANDMGRILQNMFKTNEHLSSEGDIQFKLQEVETRNSIFEIKKILDSYNSLVKQTNHMIKLTLDANKHAAIASVACQVSHDIRSPLAALAMTLEVTQNLPEEIRLLMRSSINRIRDIANHLIDPVSNLKSLCQPETNEKQVYLLSGLIDDLISEKRMQFREKINIEIEAHLGPSSYGIFSKINLTEFKRVLSNLINNAVEALELAGKVSIKLEKNDDFAAILVNDNGIGIPEEILEKIGKRGVSYGKKNGTGLGLYHAKNTLRLWNGNLKIVSIPQKGTTVILQIPLAISPRWFVQRLYLNPFQQIIIFDDDMSIHQIWNGRLHPFIESLQIELISLSTPDQLRIWVNSSSLNNVLFLVDYELLNFHETGLDLILELHLQKMAILVTSRFEEAPIIKHCEDENIQLIPKGMAPFVPIEACNASHV